MFEMPLTICAADLVLCLVIKEQYLRSMVVMNLLSER